MTPGWRISWPRRRSCRGRSSPICSAPRSSHRTEAALEDKTQSALEKAVILLRAHTGHDFSLYKRNTLYRRIERRMGIHQIDKMAAYVRYLQENSQELDLLFKELLIGVTSFFRDPAAWEQLREAGHPGAARQPAARPGAARVGARLLHRGGGLFPGHRVQGGAGASSSPQRNFTLQIFATDLDQDAIDKARQGVYPANIAADVSPERLSRFFTKEEHGYRVRKEIREMVIFAPQNLIMDPPFTKLDILSCRNLLIYLTPELQKKLIPLFHYSLQSRRHPVSRQRGDDRRLHRPVCPAERQVAALPADGVRHAAGAGRVSLVL